MDDKFPSNEIVEVSLKNILAIPFPKSVSSFLCELYYK